MSFYKFENYTERTFPVYSSKQIGSGNIVVPHYHSDIEIIKVDNSVATIYIDTKKFECKDGDIIFIPPYCVHSVFSNNKNTVITGVVFSASIINAELFIKPPYEFLNKDLVNDYVIPSTFAQSNAISECVSMIYNLYRERPLKKALIYSELIKISYYINNIYNSEKTNNNNLSKISPVIKYINENLSQDIDLSTLSNLINVSNNHLIRLFKSATNKTPVKYINDARIEQAMKLLIKSDFTITEIAIQVGFANVNYMSNVFKRTLNIKPSEYRKKTRS